MSGLLLGYYYYWWWWWWWCSSGSSGGSGSFTSSSNSSSGGGVGSSSIIDFVEEPNICCYLASRSSLQSFGRIMCMFCYVYVSLLVSSKSLHYFRRFVHMCCVTGARLQNRYDFSVECCASFSLHVLLGMFERYVVCRYCV